MSKPCLLGLFDSFSESAHVVKLSLNKRVFTEICCETSDVQIEIFSHLW